MRVALDAARKAVASSAQGVARGLHQQGRSDSRRPATAAARDDPGRGRQDS